ncbi:MAG: undecaprenyl-phosphate glucose phosphotransferase [Candidatus Dormibacteria bacterium]
MTEEAGAGAQVAEAAHLAPARMHRAHSVQPWFTIALLLGDALGVAAALVLAYRYRFYVDRIPIPGVEVPNFVPYVRGIPVLWAAVIPALAANRAYVQKRGRSFVDEVYSLVGGVGMGSVLLLAAMSLYRGFSYSRLVVFYMGLAGTVILVFFRLGMRAVLGILRSNGRGITRALVVGTGMGAEELINRLEMFPQYGYQLVGVVDDGLVEGEDYHRLPVLGDSKELCRLIHRYGIDEVFVALPRADHRQVLRLINQCDDSQAVFKIVPDLLGVITTGVEADDIDGLPLVSVRRSRLVGANVLVKRIFDLVLGALLLIPGSVVMALIALAIRINSPGPVIYRQERVGKDLHNFTAYKFRSMVDNAEAETGPVFAQRDDPRMTAVGRFLRRTSFDEIPQIWNVFKGEMSLVGPRPERPHFVAQFNAEVPGYVRRHEVLPGITGWAQLNDLRQETPIEQRTIYDSYYVENWSLPFDLKILFLTFARIFFHRNAY